VNDVNRMLYGELGASKMELQDEIWHSETGLGAVLDRAVATVVEAGKPEHANDQFRPCVHEDLLLVYQFVDLPGYADQLERIASRFVHELDASSQCHFCMAFLHVQGLYGARKLAEAERAVTTYIAELSGRNTKMPWHPRWLDLLCVRADIADAADDIERLRTTVGTLVTERANVDKANTALRAGIAVAELRLACRDDDAAVAARCFAAVIAEIVPAADFALAGRTIYAAYLARKQRWSESLAIAQAGIAPARTRQATRWLAELLLLALEASEHVAGGTSAVYGTELATVLVKLKSRDLDARAKR
jgi:hypothetical protein